MYALMIFQQRLFQFKRNTTGKNHNPAARRGCESYNALIWVTGVGSGFQRKQAVKERAVSFQHNAQLFC